jgi:hypothetical protein
MVALALLAIAAAGCGGGGSSKSSSHKPYTFDELVGIVGPAPETPEGASYSIDIDPATYSLNDLPHTTNAEKALVASFRKAGFKRIYQRTFAGALNNALATTYLFGTANGATSGYVELQKALSHPAAASGETATEVSSDGLGDEAWGAHVTGESEGALYIWRTANLVVVADMSCEGDCAFDVVSALRTYADGIDGRAKAG